MTTSEVQIPKTYKAAVYNEPGKISTKVEELNTPEPGPGEILINLWDSIPC
jgi:propanol-preferring alcohol dehydrogenase